MRYAGSHRLGGRPRRSRILCCMTGVATSVRSVTEVASGNRCRGASSGFRKTPSCAARPAGPSTSQAPAAPPRNRRREIMLKAKGHAEQERVRGVLGTLGGQEVRDGSQALVLVGPRALERRLEDDERHRAIGQAERGAVHEAILLSGRRELAAGEVRLLNEPVQPDLFHPGRSYELRVVELPAKDRVPQKVGKEAVPEVQPIPLLARGQTGRLEVDHRVQGRRAVLELPLEDGVGKSSADPCDPVVLRYDVLALDLERPKVALPSTPTPQSASEGRKSGV